MSWIAHDNLCANNLYRHGTEAQRRRYLPGLCSGKLVGALALTEPGAGSDALGSMRMSARRDGDHYVLNGTKIFITNGPVADVLITYAKTAPELGTHGISAFIVQKDFPGFSVAQKLTKMGFRGSQTGELVFDNCRVPVENRLGAENAGLAVVMTGLDLERATIAPICLGIAERALQLSIDYAKTRKQFGRPIAEFEMIQAKIADMYVWVETMRCFVYRVLAATDRIGADTRRPRRDARTERRGGDVRLRNHGQGRVRRAADPRRQRLYLGVGGQPPVSCDQDAGDRRRYDRSAQAHHQRRAAATSGDPAAISHPARSGRTPPDSRLLPILAMRLAAFAPGDARALTIVPEVTAVVLLALAVSALAAQSRAVSAGPWPRSRAWRGLWAVAGPILRPTRCARRQPH